MGQEASGRGNRPAAGSEVTVVVVPRERFSMARRSLESVFAHTRHPHEMVYVAAGAPRSLRRYLGRAARERGFRLLHSERLIAPSRARKLGLAEVRTKYVVFLDNDVLVQPGWLGALVRCAEETGAAVVGPLYLFHAMELGIVHMAGGEVEIEEADGRRGLTESYYFPGRPLEEVRPQLRRRQCGLVEFHCLLARREHLQRCGAPDDGYLSGMEHQDLCLTIRKDGGSIWMEPAAVITYLPAYGARWGDRRFQRLRWCREWNRRSVGHFAEKWGLPADDPALRGNFEFMESIRLRGYRGWNRFLPALFGKVRAARALAWVDRVTERLLVEPLLKRHGPPVSS